MLIYYFISNHIIVCYSIFYNIFYEIRIITGYILYIRSGYLVSFMKIQGVENKDLDCPFISEISTICKYLPGINILSNLLSISSAHYGPRQSPSPENDKE